MAEEVVLYLLENYGSKFLDCTFGAGGHSSLLIERATHPIEVTAIDLDYDAIAAGRERFAGIKSLRIEHGDYGRLGQNTAIYGWGEFDGILADFGQSSDQIASEAAGMSYQRASILDMRYNRTSGLTAGEYLNSVDYPDFKRALKEIGQETNAARIAAAVIKARPLTTTGDLERAVRAVTPTFESNKTLSRVFMVIRVVVNDELGAIDRFLEIAPTMLRSGGRIICISFDSNQDRRVKTSFRTLANPCTCPPNFPICVCHRKPTFKILTQHALKSSPNEISSNKRSRSARLRAAEKI